MKSKTGSKIVIHEDGYYDTSDVSKLYQTDGGSVKKALSH